MTCARARFVWCLAEEDRVALGLDAGSSAVLPLVTGSATVAPHPTTSPEFDVGLIGTWNWEPNRIGLDWFLREVAPLLPADIRVGVAGRVPEATAALAPGSRHLGGSRSRMRPPSWPDAAPSRSPAGPALASSSRPSRPSSLASPPSRRVCPCAASRRCPPMCVRADDAATFAAALAGLVREVRAGTVTDIDGAAFLREQREAMRTALARGLSVLRRGLRKNPLSSRR